MLVYRRVSWKELDPEGSLRCTARQGAHLTISPYDSVFVNLFQPCRQKNDAKFLVERVFLFAFNGFFW